MEKIIIGNAELYLGDCLDILPTLPQADALITDPPYGLQENAYRVANKGKLAKTTDYGNFEWDRKPASDEQIQLCLKKGEEVIIFGGNYFNLPPSRCWLVWDKDNTGYFADAELAWTNIKGSVRLIKHRWNGMVRQTENKFPRVHPTQKPIAVMEWAISQCKNDPFIILDPFMGSGTTGVASINLGRKFIGIEKETKYFDIACERIDQAQKQIRLFA